MHITKKTYKRLTGTCSVCGGVTSSKIYTRCRLCMVAQTKGKNSPNWLGSAKVCKICGVKIDYRSKTLLCLKHYRQAIKTKRNIYTQCGKCKKSKRREK